MDPGLLDMLHDSGDHHVFAVRQRVHVHFRRILQKLVNQNRPLRIRKSADQRRLRHILFHRLQIVSDHHRASAQHITRPHQHRQTNFIRQRHRFLRHESAAVARRRNFQFVQQRAKSPAIFRQVNRLRRRPNNLRAIFLQLQRQIQGRLPAKLYDNALRLFAVQNRQHVFQCQRLEIQTIRSVVVRGNCFRIAIHHDRFVSVFFQRKRSVAAAIIKLNPLPDAVRPAAQNHHLRTIHRRRFILFFVRRIQIRCKGFELRRAGIHPLEHRLHAQFFASRAHARCFHAPQFRDFLIARARPLRFQQ